LARKILLADDSVTAQNMGRKILADAGYEVITVNNGSAALKKIAELKPDLVILDVYMPGYSGLEVCQRLKESQDSNRIPVLLTVGKLEPFKPEEARRVRAEGFIVKPFEASELLSALSKLEDKVVPRAEPSKPGRFARAIAAAEESSRIARNDASGDDGWKSRIAFPHEKTAEEKVAEEDSTYNPVNRDLRTVVERPAEKPAEPRAAMPHSTPDAAVDVAALAPPGFPQDVTPEEVAAIAAAAAQIQMAAAIRDSQSPSTAESTMASSTAIPEKSSAESLATATQPASQADETSREIQPASVPAVNAEVEANAVTGYVSSEEAQDAPVNDVPVTMAAATQSVAAADGNASRWTAVAVALEAEEVMVSLEQEMQKAYAAFVAEEAAPANETAEIAFSQNLPAAAEAPAEPQAESISSSEVMSPPQPEAVATADTPSTETAPLPQIHPDAASSAIDAGVAEVPESTAFVVPQPEPVLAEPAATEVQAAPPSQFPEPNSEAASDPVSAVAETPAAPEELPPAPQSEPAIAETAASSNAFAPIIRNEPAEEQKIDAQYQDDQPHDNQLNDDRRNDDRLNDDQPKEDSETLKSTAAAWASWRQIRDTGDAKPGTAEPVRAEFSIPDLAPAESAAMAVAAGAEQNVQESTTPPSENPHDVASIVDSVLADLRPRLMAEITRKMSEKK
jgi:two-component system, chemotaxis family, chemotaxis protein CheY